MHFWGLFLCFLAVNKLSFVDDWFTLKLGSPTCSCHTISKRHLSKVPNFLAFVMSCIFSCILSFSLIYMYSVFLSSSYYDFDKFLLIHFKSIVLERNPIILLFIFWGCLYSKILFIQRTHNLYTHGHDIVILSIALYICSILMIPSLCF